MSKVKLNDVAFEAKAKYKAVEGVPIKTVGLEHLTPSDIDLNDYAIGAKTTFAKGFSKDDILFGRRRAYQKKAAIAPFDGVCSSDITVIRAIDGAINKKLLPFIIQNEYFFDYAMRNSAGSMSPRVKWAQLGEFEFELPSPSRQDELVNLLWAIQEARRDYKAIIDECGNVIKSQFVEMFLSSSWPVATIGECATDIHYGTSEKASTEGEYVYLRMNNIGDDGSLDLSDTKRITLEAKALSNCLVRKGDLLFNRTNSREKVGKTCVFCLEEPMVVAGYIIRVRLDDRVDSTYLAAYMNLSSTKALLRGMAKCAVHQANINAKQLASIEFPLADIEAQKEFVAFVAEVDKSKFDTRKALKSLNSTSNAILNEELGLNHG